VIPTTQRRVFRSHMHFQVLEEVLVLMWCERYQHTDGTG
jgi:hypothetical protein